MFNLLLLILVIILLSGQLVPWIQLRSRGVSLSFLEYGYPIIKKSIFANKHNKKVFDALQIVQTNNLDISILEIQEMYKANVDFQKFIDAFLLAKNKNIITSKEDLIELAYTKKDLTIIINAKNPGEEIVMAEYLVRMGRG